MCLRAQRRVGRFVSYNFLSDLASLIVAFLPSFHESAGQGEHARNRYAKAERDEKAPPTLHG